MHTEIIRRLGKESVLIFIFSCALFACTLSLRHVAVPRIKAVGALKAELGQYRKLISSEDGYRELKKEIVTRNDLLKSRAQALTGGSDARDLSGLLEVLIEKAGLADIRFVKMQPQAESRNEDFVLYPVVLEMTTTFNALGRFVASLEASPQLLRVERVALAAGHSGKLDIKILVTCLIPARGDS